MTPHQIGIVRETFKLVEARAEVTALVFYQRLFALDPSLRPLFRTNIDEQGQKLMQMLGVAVALLEQPFALVPALEALGRRHAGYGIEARHYDTVGTALLEMLAECLGSTFTHEVMEAWSALYAIVACAMQRGARIESTQHRRSAAGASPLSTLNSTASQL
jgi:hemoglobin-like flavoprotein